MPFVITTDENIVINTDHVVYAKKDGAKLHVALVNGGPLVLDGEPARLLWEGLSGDAEIWNWPAE